MKASELIEKIHNREIKSGTKIICHKKNEYFDYEVTRWFMGNWFSKVPPEEHTSSSDYDNEFICNLCDESVTYKIIEDNEIEKITKKTNKVLKRELIYKLNELTDAVNELKKEGK